MALLALMALSALVCAPSAAAKKKKPRAVPILDVTATASTSADNQPATATAVCPPGKIAVGGGFSSPETTTGGNVSDLNIVYESRRVSTTSWRVSAVREDASGAGPTLTLFAIVNCRTAKLQQKASKKKKKLKITEVAATGAALAGSGAFGTANAVCPGKQKPIGGGFSSSPTPVLAGSLAFPFHYESFRSAANTWSSSMVNSGSTARTVTSYAYCSATATTQTTATATLPGTAAMAPGIGLATAPACPKKRGLLGEGFATTRPSGTTAQGVLTDLKGAARQAIFRAFNEGAVAGTVAAYGYCL
jgi:hypothetical protein